MVSRLLSAAIAASCLLQFAHAQSSDPASGALIPTATTTPAMNALTKIGCFSTPTPMVDHGPYTFQSSGNCQPICYDLQQPVMGLVNGTNCWCGALLPPKDSQVSNNSCNTPCAGIDTELCMYIVYFQYKTLTETPGGGDNFWTVYLTGVTRNQIANLDPASASASASSTKTSTASAGPSTVVVTDSPKSGKSNTVGIAVGVVVGLIAIAAIGGGIFFWIRHNQRKEAEDEYKRQEGISSFVEGGKKPPYGGSAGNDSRLDPTLLAARRISDGSIADNADYSRRILQVTNPDRETRHWSRALSDFGQVRNPDGF